MSSSNIGRSYVIAGGPPSLSMSGERGWPVNEIILHALLSAGWTHAEIAARYAVSPDQVGRLCDLYDL